MSYALGTKLVPGQIAFQTTRTGRLPSLQPLIEAGLPYAPYIEHGSWTTGRPDIARYGRDPYRGLGDAPRLSEEAARTMCSASGGRWVPIPGAIAPGGTCEGGTREVVEDTIRGTIQKTLPPAVLIGTGAVAGAAGGIAGGLFGKAFLGGLVGAVGGGVLGYLGWKMLPKPEVPSTPALSGVMAVL